MPNRNHSRTFLILGVVIAAVVVVQQFWYWEVERIEVQPQKYLVRIHRWGKDLPEGEIVAPDDSSSIYAFEATGGRRVWKTDPLPDEVKLAHLLGGNIRKQIAALASTAWRSDPWSRGSYSYALPGHADDRAMLAAPVNDRLFFAGEACSPNFFSTAHGAWLSGIAAADAALASLKAAAATR